MLLCGQRSRPRERVVQRAVGAKNGRIQVGEEGRGRCGKRAGMPPDMAARLKALERENPSLGRRRAPGPHMPPVREPPRNARQTPAGASRR